MERINGKQMSKRLCESDVDSEDYNGQRRTSFQVVDWSPKSLRYKVAGTRRYQDEEFGEKAVERLCNRCQRGKNA